MLEKIQYLFTHHAVLSQELMWVCFGIAVVVLLFLDLCVFNRKNEVPSFAHTLWVCIAARGFCSAFLSGMKKALIRLWNILPAFWSRRACQWTISS